MIFRRKIDSNCRRRFGGSADHPQTAGVADPHKVPAAVDPVEAAPPDLGDQPLAADPAPDPGRPGRRATPPRPTDLAARISSIQRPGARFIGVRSMCRTCRHMANEA
jgi:hypothetical protein